MSTIMGKILMISLLIWLKEDFMSKMLQLFSFEIFKRYCQNFHLKWMTGLVFIPCISEIFLEFFNFLRSLALDLSTDGQ